MCLFDFLKFDDPYSFMHFQQTFLGRRIGGKTKSIVFEEEAGEGDTINGKRRRLRPRASWMDWMKQDVVYYMMNYIR